MSQNEKLEEYVVWTDKGYLKGDNYVGVKFVEKEEARVFSFDEICLYRDSIAADMFDFYDCKELQVEIR